MGRGIASRAADPEQDELAERFKPENRPKRAEMPPPEAPAVRLTPRSQSSGAEQESSTLRETGSFSLEPPLPHQMTLSW